MEEFGFANGPAAVDMPSIQWFPGHMAKTRRLMADSLRLVDILVELADARIPVSSRNPEIGRLAGQKPRVLLLNKCDAADDAITRRWLDYYAGAGLPALAADCRSGRGLGAFLPLVRETLAPQLAKRAAKGMAGQPVRMMVVGVPNVGKSSLINMLTDRPGLAKVSSTPGKTRLINHFKINAKWYLVDLPGYGYARVSKNQRGEFSKLITDYVQKREAMVFLFVLIDSRLDPQKIDLDFIRMLGEHGVPFGLIFTKCDKQSDDRTSSNMAKFRRKMLETWEELPPVFRTSSEKKTGRDDVLDFIGHCLETVGDTE